ncbi:MAG: hypothetical protein QW331_03575, partial [Candidatus Woesearchaeota archaeon]
EQIGYSGGNLTFNVLGFSTYSAQETPTTISSFSSSGGGGGSKGTFLTELALDLKPGEEKTLELTRGQYVNFIVNGQKHKAQFIGLIIGITSKYATFFIYSTKINKKVVEGEMVSVDVNGDNMDDLEITYLEKITNMKAKFKFKSLAGGVSPSVPEVPTMPQPLAVEAPPSPQIVTQPAEESQLPVQLPAYEAPAPVEKLFYETIVDKYGVEVISGMGVLLVVILLFVSVAKIRAKESKAKNFSDLVNYIQQVKQQGYRDTQIKEALIKSG